jgi:hypothetical protein
LTLPHHQLVIPFWQPLYKLIHIILRHCNRWQAFASVKKNRKKHLLHFALSHHHHQIPPLRVIKLWSLLFLFLCDLCAPSFFWSAALITMLSMY